MKHYVKISYFSLCYVATIFDGPIVLTDTNSTKITVRVHTRFEIYPKDLTYLGLRCLRARFYISNFVDENIFRGVGLYICNN